MGCVRPAPLTATCTYRDARGHRQTVRVTTTMAAQIRAVREQAARAERSWEARHVTFTDAEVDPRRVAEGATPRPRPSQAGNAWVGPRYAFAALLGEGRIWPGPRLADVQPLVAEVLRAHPDAPWPKAVRKRSARGRCDFCRGAWLGPGVYCTRCDRSGRDDEIPRPSRTELSRIRAPQDDGLKGGV